MYSVMEPYSHEDSSPDSTFSITSSADIDAVSFMQYCQNKEYITVVYLIIKNQTLWFVAIRCRLAF